MGSAYEPCPNRILGVDNGDTPVIQRKNDAR